MTPQQHARSKEIFLAACALPPAQRAAHIQTACGTDEALRAQVEKLLKHHTESPNDKPLLGSAGSGSSAIPPLAPDSPANHPWQRQRELPPGTTLADRYRIVALLGRGGMGEVYRAEDLRLRQPVALKFLPPALAGDPAWLARLHNEVRVARTVTHPNVCRVHDIIEADGETFISMEYIDGENLKTLLRRIGRLPPDKALEIGRQLCLGLAAAHAKGVLHRDLKPANVMIDGRGQVRITDFGLAGLLGEIAAAELRAGTPAYMAPEQWAGREVTQRSDIYALGLVLYEIFTGRPPYQVENIRDFARLEEDAPPPSSLVPDMPPAVERIILRCLEKDPALRPASAAAVAAALYGDDPLAAALAAGETPSPELVAAAGEKIGRRSFVTVGELAVFFVLLALAVWLSARVHPLYQTPLHKSPAILAEKAREMIQQIYALPPPVDEAWGFCANSCGGLVPIITGSPVAAQQYATSRPDAPLFWYRRADAGLVPANPMSVVFGRGRVTLLDPPPLHPGMITVALDGDGRLLGLERIPGPVVEKIDPPKVADWPALLSKAGLSPETLAPPETQATRPISANPYITYRTGSGAAPTDARQRVRVEAVEYDGAPLFFAVLAADKNGHPLVAEEDADWTAPAWRRTLVRTARAILLTALFLISVPLAFANFRRGRSDPRGALRLTAFVFAIREITWLLWAHHVPNLFSTAQAVLLASVGALGEAFLVWLFYTALEPYVRRHWPHALIAWSRLLEGRFRDPLVGQNLLRGAALGAVWALLVFLDQLVPAWLGWPARGLVRLDDLFDALDGARPALAFVIHALWEAIYMAVFLLLLVLLLRVALRRVWLAQLAAIFLFAPLCVPLGSHPITATIFIGGVVVSMIWLMTRYGLVMIATGIFVAFLLIRLPLTFDWRPWYADLSLLAISLPAALALYGFWTARRSSDATIPA